MAGLPGPPRLYSAALPSLSVWLGRQPFASWAAAVLNVGRSTNRKFGANLRLEKLPRVRTERRVVVSQVHAWANELNGVVGNEAHG